MFRALRDAVLLSAAVIVGYAHEDCLVTPALSAVPTIPDQIQADQNAVVAELTSEQRKLYDAWHPRSPR